MRRDEWADDLYRDIVGACPHEVFYSAPEPVEPNSLLIQVNRAGIALHTPPDFLVTRDDTYPYSMIHCVLYGRGTVSARGHTHHVHARQLFVLSSNEGHMYSSDPGDPMGVVWVEYAGGNSAQLTAHILDHCGPVLGGPVFTDIVNQMTALLYQPRQEGPGISLLLYGLLMTLCKQVSVETSARRVNHEILQYIEENLDRKLTLTEVAQVFGYHPAYFSNYFSRMTGVTFSKYVTRRKISHACYLLETTSWTVERIARELGFFDISHFIQRFKAHKGVTPAAYREESVLYQKKQVRKRP